MSLFTLVYAEVYRVPVLVKVKHFSRNLEEQRASLHSTLPELARYFIKSQDISSDLVKLLTFHTAEALLYLFLVSYSPLENLLSLLISESSF